MIKIAVIGVGGWGRNLVRNYHEIPEADLKYICDVDELRLRSVAGQAPTATPTTNIEEVLADPAVDAVVVATPGPTHYTVCRLALDAGKDVYVEKPFTLASGHASDLIARAEKRDRILMVGHLLEYHPVVERLKEMVLGNELGDIYYMYSQRLNLGTVREDENALWNFAPHDISIILHLLDREPTDVSARGQCYLRPGIEDVVFMSLNFNGQAMAHVHVSWLDPHKVRKFTIVGSRKMAVFDDLGGNEKLRIYDKGAKQGQLNYETYAEYLGLRFGDITVPHISMGEPLRAECRHFLDCVANRKQPRSDGLDGLRVVRVLEAAQKSLRMNGQPVPVEIYSESASAA
jgi:predicted dehydrogenase